MRTSLEGISHGLSSTSARETRRRAFSTRPLVDHAGRYLACRIRTGIAAAVDPRPTVADHSGLGLGLGSGCRRGGRRSGDVGPDVVSRRALDSVANRSAVPNVAATIAYRRGATTNRLRWPLRLPATNGHSRDAEPRLEKCVENDRSGQTACRRTVVQRRHAVRPDRRDRHAGHRETADFRYAVCRYAATRTLARLLPGRSHARRYGDRKRRGTDRIGSIYGPRAARRLACCFC